MDCELAAVTMTGGEREQYVDGYYRVPKRDLIVGLQIALDSGALQIAAGMKEGPALVRELSEMRVTVGETGVETWRSGEHDDCVIAVALAVWRAKRRWL